MDILLFSAAGLGGAASSLSLSLVLFIGSIAMTVKNATR
jgi:hypothetical protein